MNKLPLIKPGDIIINEFLIPNLAKGIKIDINLMGDIINAKKSITKEIAEKLSKYFGCEAQFWLNLQKQYDKEKIE